MELHNALLHRSVAACPHSGCTDDSTAASVPAREGGHALQRLLREKGTDAVVDEILRPGRELWAQIKDALLKPDGSMYFSDHVESTLLPEMSGVLVTQDGSDLLVAMSGADVPDVTLRLQTPMKESGALGATVSSLVLRSNSHVSHSWSPCW